MQTNSKIWVTGHSGLLGSALVRRLRALGYNNLCLAARDRVNLLDQRATFDFIQQESPEHVFVCAAKVGGIQANINSPGSFLYENLQIQNNVLEGCRNTVKKLLFVGSSCIYPREAPNPLKEESLLTGALEPTNEAYGLAKLAGIRMCEYYRRQYGSHYIAAVPTNLFGINDNYDLETAHLVPALIHKIHKAKQAGQKDFVLWGSGKPRREFMSSDDCADALVFLMEHYDEVRPINVGIGRDMTVVEIAETICRVLNAPLEIKLDPSRPDGMMRKLVDTTRLSALGWSSKIPFESGVRVSYEDFLSRY